MGQVKTKPLPSSVIRKVSRRLKIHKGTGLLVYLFLSNFLLKIMWILKWKMVLGLTCLKFG